MSKIRAALLGVLAFAATASVAFATDPPPLEIDSIGPEIDMSTLLSSVTQYVPIAIGGGLAIFGVVMGIRLFKRVFRSASS